MCSAKLDSFPFSGLSTCEDDTLEFIDGIAKSQGLKSNYIMKLIPSLESTEISEKIKLKVIEWLIPEKDIPEGAFIRLICLLSNFKVSLDLKLEILKWMIAAFSFMEIPLGMSNIRFLYEIFFTLLEQEMLRPLVCQFMVLITYKELVTARRVNNLFKLIKRYGKQPCLLLILHTYYMFCPYFFEDEMHHDIEHADIESLGVYPSLIRKIHPNTSFNLHTSSIFGNTQEINTGTFSEICDSQAEKSSETSLFKIGSFPQTYQEYKALEASKNISDMLNSRLSRLFLTSELSPKMRIKINDYILTKLHLSLPENLDSCEFLENNLDLITQNPIAGISGFTEELISRAVCSTGNERKMNISPSVVMKLLHSEPIICFEKNSYKMDLLREEIFAVKDVSKKCEWLNCISQMYVNWVLQCDSCSFIPCQGECSESLFQTVNERSSLPEAHLPASEINKLGSYIDLICNGLIMSDDFGPFILNEILLHYEKVSIIHMKQSNFAIHLPICPVFHLALFSLSYCTLENLSRLMLRIRAEIRHMEVNSNPETEIAAHYFKRCCHDLRKTLLDDGYDDADNTYLSGTSIFKKLNKGYENYTDYFILQKHPALLMKTMTFAQRSQLENFQTNPDVALNFLQHIAEDGSESLAKLITLFMKMMAVD